MKARPKPFEPDARPVDDAGFLAAIGATVREAREQRGMARKMLSRVADVSERYLAQLEAGEGNASITLLRRVAEALGIGLKDLLDASERRPVRRNRIALIGLRGAGKSTLGGQLAKTLRRPFVELDREIERDAGMSLSESQQELVLTVGGGIVSEAETYNRLLANCFTVWIKASPEEHMARVVAQGDLRPMRGQPEAMKDLRRILASRQPLYGKADVAIDTSRQSVPQSLAALKKCVSPTTAERNR